MKTKTTFLLCAAVLLSIFLQAAVPAAQANKVTIHGALTDTEGKPVRGFVSVSDSHWNFLAWTESNWAGNYSLQVPKSAAYIIQVQPSGSNTISLGSASFASGFLDQYKYAAPAGDDLEVNYTLQPGGAIWLKTYTPDGRYVFQQDKYSDWKIGIYPLGGSPAAPSLQYLYHQGSIFWGWQNGSDKNHPVALVPAETPVELWIHWPVPEVGDTFIHLDNDGQGYTVKRGGVLAVNVLYEAARTEYRLFQERLAAYQASGYTFTDEISQWNDEAAQALEQARTECPNENLSACIPASYTVLTRVLRAREEAVFQSAQQDIEKYRKADVTVRLTDCSGAALAGVEVNYQQTSHDFIFAAGWPDGTAQAKTLAEAGFNSAAHEAWWNEVMTAPGKFTYHDSNFAPITRAGMKIAMHTGIWISPGWMPPLTQDMGAADLVTLAHDFSYNFTRHYAGRMNIYNAFNEPQNAFDFMPLTKQDIVDIAAASVQGAQEGAPGVPTYVNFYAMYLGNLSWTPNSANETYPQPDELIQALLAENVPFDNIGLEFYNGVVAPTIDIGIFDDTLEYYRAYGKTIFVSELSYGTTEELAAFLDNKPWYRDGWHAGHTDEAQAEWARYTYTVAFSKPYVTGVMWVSAGELPPGEMFSGDGLFNLDGTPRPIVDTIGGLIRSWTTSGAAQTDPGGVLTLRGFAGDYTLTWSNPDGTPASAEIHVSQGGENEFTVQPAACTQVTPTLAPALNVTATPPSAAPETGHPAFPAWAIALAGVLLMGGAYLFFRARKHPK
jgi:hypothetical protein